MLSRISVERPGGLAPSQQPIGEMTAESRAEMTPDDVQKLFQSGPPAADESRLSEKADRIAALRNVLVFSEQLWRTGDPELDLIAEKLGDGSRDGELASHGRTGQQIGRPGMDPRVMRANEKVALWRLPIGESGLLSFFLGILSTEGLRQSLSIHALRLIGNSCADTGTSSGALREAFPPLMDCQMRTGPASWPAVA